MHSRAASGRSTFLGSTSSTFFRVVATQKRKYYQAFYVTHGLQHAATTDSHTEVRNTVSRTLTIDGQEVIQQKSNHWHNLPSRNWSSRVSSCSIDTACKSSQPGMSSLRSGGNRPHLGRSLTRSPSPLLSFQTQHDVKLVHLQDSPTRCSIGALQHFRIPGSTHEQQNRAVTQSSLRVVVFCARMPTKRAMAPLLLLESRRPDPRCPLPRASAFDFRRPCQCVTGPHIVCQRRS